MSDENSKRISVARGAWDFLNRPNFPIFLGSGLYLISIGIMLYLTVSFLIGISIIIVYPLINPSLLQTLRLIAVVLIILGIITLIFPIIERKKNKDGMLVRSLRFLMRIIASLILLFIPIGIFLGMGLHSNLSKIEPHGKDSQEGKEFSFYNDYIPFIFIAGLFHTIIGVLLIYFIPSLLLEELLTLFPYINYGTIIFVGIIGLLNLISGLVLTFCSLYLKKNNSLETIEKKAVQFRILRKLILISSILIMTSYPIGTFFGLTLLQIFYPYQKK